MASIYVLRGEGSLKVVLEGRMAGSPTKLNGTRLNGRPRMGMIYLIRSS